jgi:polysaccharide deacetylase 2 family uncharacterized protein YibQ
LLLSLLLPLVIIYGHLTCARSMFGRVIISLWALSAMHTYGNTDFDHLIELNPAYGDEASDVIILPPHNDHSPAQADVLVAPISTPTINGTTNEKPQTIKIAIIIDDIGYNYAQGVAAITLPGNLTYAIIPHSPKADFFAAEAKKHHKEIMLHAPMSNIHNIPLGEHGLTEDMGEVDFKRSFNLALDSLPNISGVNNHMGSLLTQKTQPMEWVMQALQKRKLYFIDSRTTSDSVAWETAQAFNIPSLSRDVFLDHTPTTEFIDQQFKQLTAIAKRKGYAVGIAHPYPETIQYLKEQLPLLKQQNIALVPASELVFGHSPNLVSLKYTKM